MHIRLLAVGARQPDWVSAAVTRYQERLPRQWRFDIVEIDAGRGAAATPEKQAPRILAACREREHLVALDERGRQFSSAAFAKRLATWLQDGTDLAFVIGGADGLAPAVMARATERVSLSAMTLPHGLARVFLVEQLYRAQTLIDGHPYHRAG